MAEQFITDRRPGAPQHTATGCRTAPDAKTWIVDQDANRGAQCGSEHFVSARVEGLWKQETGAAVVHQVPRTAGVRGDHRQPTGQRVLHSLAERLEGPGVHEDVQTGVRLRQLITGLEPQEGSTG